MEQVFAPEIRMLCVVIAHGNLRRIEVDDVRLAAPLLFLQSGFLI